jgi:hypothetical protein
MRAMRTGRNFVFRPLMKRFSVIGVMMLLTMAISIYGVTAAGASAPPPNSAMAYKATHTFTLHRNGTAVTETCFGYSAISKSTAYPGYMATYAWVQDCTPDPAEFCAQTGDLQIGDLYTGVWNPDGTGPTRYGCAGTRDASTRTWPCRSTDYTLAYRTQAIFVAIDSAGDTLTWSGESPKHSVLRIC